MQTIPEGFHEVTFCYACGMQYYFEPETLQRLEDETLDPTDLLCDSCEDIKALGPQMTDTQAAEYIAQVKAWAESPEGIAYRNKPIDEVVAKEIS